MCRRSRAVPYEPFSRAAVVAIALTEWRAFGSPIDDDPPGTRPPPAPDAKPERAAGAVAARRRILVARAGRGTARDALDREARRRAASVFPADEDGRYAWSAAFVSYVMRIAGAGARFPYAPAHDTYINRAREMSLGRATGWLITAESPAAYAPQPGDLICMSRTTVPLSFADLPAGRFPAHCDIVVGAAPGVLDVVGGNVDDAVTLKHVPVTAAGRLADADGHVQDARYPWFVVLRLVATAPN